MGSDHHCDSEWAFPGFPISIKAKQALDISGTPTIIAEARDNSGESKITIWRKEKVPIQQMSNLKSRLNHAGQIVKNVLFLLMLLMAVAFISQNAMVSYFNHRRKYKVAS